MGIAFACHALRMQQDNSSFCAAQGSTRTFSLLHKNRGENTTWTQKRRVGIAFKHITSSYTQVPFVGSYYSTVCGSPSSSSSCSAPSHPQLLLRLSLPSFLVRTVSSRERDGDYVGGLSYPWLQLSVLPSNWRTWLVCLKGRQASNTHTQCWGFGLVTTFFELFNPVTLQ